MRKYCNSPLLSVSVLPSDHPSATYCIETGKDIIKLFLDQLVAPLVFVSCAYPLLPNCKGNPRMRGLSRGWVGKIRIIVGHLSIS